MLSQTQTVMSIGKFPYSTLKKFNKEDYYNQRHLVHQIPLKETNFDIPDSEGQKIPSAPSIPRTEREITNLSETGLSVGNSEIRSRKVNSDFETLYYKAEADNRVLREDIESLKNTNLKLNENKESMKNNYEEFIEKLETEIGNLKQYESGFNNLDIEKRNLEEEITKLKLEMSLIRKNSGVGDDGYNENLRERIRKLNEEKLELLNNLEIQNNKVKNLKTEINYYQNEPKEENPEILRENTVMKKRIHILENNLQNFEMNKETKNERTSVIEDKVNRIEFLENKIDQLSDLLKNSKKEVKCLNCDSKNTTINYLNERIEELLKKKQKPITQNYTEISYTPRIIRKSTSRPIIERYTEYHSPINTIRRRSPRVSITRISKSPIRKSIEIKKSRPSTTFYNTNEFKTIPTTTYYKNNNLENETKTKKFSSVKYSTNSPRYSNNITNSKYINKNEKFSTNPRTEKYTNSRNEKFTNSRYSNNNEIKTTYYNPVSYYNKEPYLEEKITTTTYAPYRQGEVREVKEGGFRNGYEGKRVFTDKNLNVYTDKEINVFTNQSFGNGERKKSRYSEYY